MLSVFFLATEMAPKYSNFFLSPALSLYAPPAHETCDIKIKKERNILWPFLEKLFFMIFENARKKEEESARSKIPLETEMNPHNECNYDAAAFNPST
jgi:hypothetical protein